MRQVGYSHAVKKVAVVFSAAFFLLPIVSSADTASLVISNNGTVLAFDGGSYEQADLCGDQTCSSPSLEVIGSVTSGSVQTCLLTPGCFGSPPALTTSVSAGTYYVVYSHSYASPDHASYVTVVWDGTNWTVNGINFGAYYTPAVFSASSTGIATSSSLWGNVSIASSSVNCASDNFVSAALCSVGSYLFVPNPNIVNGLVQTANNSVAKFPFSWIYGIQTAVGGLSATSTAMSSFSINWGAISVATGSPLSLTALAPASTTVFGQTTIEHYISPSLWNVFQTLIAATIWLAFAADVFFTARNQMHRV